jgi:hypothetical protein
VALGEYSVSQVTEWLAMAAWIDVKIVIEENSYMVRNDIIDGNDHYDNDNSSNIIIYPEHHFSCYF